jgi:hypothetical protein
MPPGLFSITTRKSMKIFVLLLLASLTAGCATLGVRDSALDLEINPLPLERGKPAYAQINAPERAEKVIGTVKVMGSPQLIFQWDAKKEIWFFYGTIPFSPWVRPGSYQVRVMAYYPNAEPHYAEMKVDLK